MVCVLDRSVQGRGPSSLYHHLGTMVAAWRGPPALAGQPPPTDHSGEKKSSSGKTLPVGGVGAEGQLKEDGAGRVKSYSGGELQPDTSRQVAN